MTLLLSDILKSLPPVDQTEYRKLNHELFKKQNHTCIIIDDDPTGNQTVYDIPLLAQWDQDTLIQEFKKQTPVFFLLTNSRSLPQAKVSIIYQEISKNILVASTMTNREYTIISRSDSTLRGHFPVETNTIKQASNLDKVILVFIPVMFEGGRVTVNDIHYISDKETLIPVDKTPFAQDHSFGYTKANLSEWIEEKTEGQVSASKVFSFSIENIRTHSVQLLSKQVQALTPSSYCIVNAINYHDLDKITHALLLAEKSGKKILYRTSSSFIPSYIGITPKKLLTTEDLIPKNVKSGGLIIVGSYVPKSSAQLNYLLKYFDNNNTIEVNVEKILNDNALSYLNVISKQIEEKLNSGKDVVLYTSRKLITGSDIDDNLNIGSKVSEALVKIIKGISVSPKYILAKGGITSHDLAIKGLRMRRSKVMGQIAPGVPVWEMGARTMFPKLPYIVFPGNVGDDKLLYTITQKLS
ncbi:four-carbon acid sugar kinase family protein [Aquimarina sp. AU119]|uniref:four-carbon acid sugar kinase family protein n=1 Tax=Aquimarina sp. AU119 TaxID=2108528 RepID=UPI000D68B7D0|nr:four-carbon acid sugar kinase family protein [Aquimarina sp. AU119]